MFIPLGQMNEKLLDSFPLLSSSHLWGYCEYSHAEKAKYGRMDILYERIAAGQAG